MRDQSSETRVLLTYNMKLHQSDKNMNSAAQPTGSSLDPETLNQLILTIRKFVDERLIPLEAEVSENDAIPEDVVQEMRELGLFGLTIPQEFGGIGLNTYEECKVVMELGRTSPAFRSIFGTNNGTYLDAPLLLVRLVIDVAICEAFASTPSARRAIPLLLTCA